MSKSAYTNEKDSGSADRRNLSKRIVKLNRFIFVVFETSFHILRFFKQNVSLETLCLKKRRIQIVLNMTSYGKFLNGE